MVSPIWQTCRNGLGYGLPSLARSGPALLLSFSRLGKCLKMPVFAAATASASLTSASRSASSWASASATPWSSPAATPWTSPAAGQGENIPLLPHQDRTAMEEEVCLCLRLHEVRLRPIQPRPLKGVAKPTHKQYLVLKKEPVSMNLHFHYEHRSLPTCSIIVIVVVLRI